MLALNHECIRGPTSARERRCNGWLSCQYTGNKERSQRVGAAFIECLTRRKRHSAVERKIDPKTDGGRQLCYTHGSADPHHLFQKSFHLASFLALAALLRPRVCECTLSVSCHRKRNRRVSTGLREGIAPAARTKPPLAPWEELRRDPGGTGQGPWDRDCQYIRRGPWDQSCQ
jgi:hypothetical protein